MAHVVKTCRDKLFLLVNDNQKNIIIFLCQSNLDLLKTMETIFVDGTFKFCTKFFKQLFTVRGVQNGHYIQLCHGLLADKSTKSYDDLWDKLTATCPMTPIKAMAKHYHRRLPESAAQINAPVRNLLVCAFYSSNACVCNLLVCVVYSICVCKSPTSGKTQ